MGCRDVARFILSRAGQSWSSVRKPSASAICAAGVGIALLLVALFGVGPALGALAAPSWGVPPSASCSALANLNFTATNGNAWGRTILPGHGAAGGWFGVDVCDDGLNASAPNGANVSCDRMPDNWAKTGCAPGRATSDGYGLTFQCVELIIRFSNWAYGDRVSDWGRSGYGNAPDLWLPQNHPSDFVMYPNGSNHAPVPGDILVWGNVDSHGRPLPAGVDGDHGGHIAVVAAVRNGMVVTAEQNVKWGTADHPTDTLALTKVGSQWILSGSGQHETRLPTYRWQQTMGATRATYGWLHSTKNHGTFPSTNAPAARPSAPAKPKPAAPTQMSGGLPSLTDAVVVTQNGTLADLVWSQTSPFSPNATTTAPQAALRSLGAPENVRLAGGQTPAVVQLTDGSRFSYAVGANGHLYVARTDPGVLGVWWSDLGMPGSIRLTGSPSASTYAGGVAVAALGADGNLWWRAGPASSPGGWQLIGHPQTTALAGSFAIAGAPGNGSPLLLTLGADGRLYERIWQPEILNGDGSIQAPAGWSEWLAVHAQPVGVQLTGKLVVVPEDVNPSEWVGSWPDTPLDVLMADSHGRVWWLRSTAFASGWVLNTVPVASPVSMLVAGVVVPVQAPQNASKQASTPQSGQSGQAGQSGQSGQSGAATTNLAFYANTAQAPYEARISIPAHPHDLIAAPTWTRLAELPAGTPTGAVGTAVALGVSESSLLIPHASSALAGGLQDATSTLISFGGSTPSPSSSSTNTTNAWVALGTVATAPAFSDPLNATAVSPGWVVAGEGAKATDSANGLRIVPGDGGAAALLQGSLPGDASIAVRVSLPPSGSGVSSGVVLYLDDEDWLTLTVGQDNRVALCVEMQAKALPCVGSTAKLSPSVRTIWLRVTRHATTFTGAYSVDGQAWVDSGEWNANASSARTTTSGPAATATLVAPTPTPIATSTAQATPSAAGGALAPAQVATDIAPLGFTQWGVFVTADAGTPNLPLFKDFVVAAAPANP